MTCVHIVTLSGSLRVASINTARLREIAAEAPAGVSVAHLPIGNLPLFNPDLETSLPDVVTAFRTSVAVADGLIIASPEYAHGISCVLKNALDWLVGSTDFAGMPVLVLNTAPRATHADAALREILATMAAAVVTGIPSADSFIQSLNEAQQDMAHALVPDISPERNTAADAKGGWA
jgi:chromate reductase